MLVAAVLVLGAAAPSVQAEFEIVGFDGRASTPSGDLLTQAGAHADVWSELELSLTLDSAGRPTPDGNVRNVEVDLPPGLVGNPTATPTCPERLLTSNPMFGSQFSSCSDASQVGIVDIKRANNGWGSEFGTIFAVYNLDPPSGVPAQFGFNVFGTIIKLNGGLREGGRAVSVISPNTSQGLPLVGARVTFWGVPAAESHDAQRGLMGQLCDDGSFTPCRAHTPEKPFISLPADCAAGPFLTAVRADSWQAPGDFHTASFLSHDDAMTPVGATGCDELPFKPSIAIRPDTAAADLPTGLNVDLALPQNENPSGLATAHLEDARVTLPEGVRINPSAADGLQACSDDQLGVGSDTPIACPEASKIGTVVAATPLLEEPLQGAIYLLAQKSDDPESGKMFRIAIVLESEERGVLVKVPGQVRADRTTGQLTGTFDDNPQLPFDRLELNFKSGPRAPLATPRNCGNFTTRTELTAWSGHFMQLDEPMTIDRGCDQGSRFEPAMDAGVANPVAGGSSSFALTVTRPNGQQNISSIDLTLPPGQLAKLAGIPLCVDAQEAAGCPPASRIGTVIAGVGAGSNPLYIPQPGKAPTAVYLAGPYKGAPYSIVVGVPAQAGPFDLGKVTVRTGLYVDPTTAQVTAKSDPLPQILSGIPIEYQKVNLTIDRVGFIQNPTNCSPMSVNGSITSDKGMIAKVTKNYQVGDCASLAFKPKLAIRLMGKTHRSAHPKLRATLTMPKGGANIARAQVTLPKTEFLENAHIKTICTRVQYAARTCPAQSVYGYAKAWSPLLDQPLEGPVYLRSSNNPLPDLVASLDGQIHVDLVGRIDAVNARIRNTFDLVPDAPVSKFVLTMQGGKKGLLVNNTELCKAKPRASVKFDAHNGKVSDYSPVVKADCGKGRRGR